MTTDLMGKPVSYIAKSGEDIKITPGMVVEFLVRGKKDLVTKQELVFFLHTCKAKKLNPFIGDCYLVKYSDNDPAAIITSRRYYEQTAMENERCGGWTNGIVVSTTDGQIIEREGTILFDGETLIGGWAETNIKGWLHPKKWTVGLAGAIKTTKGGYPTKFWSVEKQPHMIAKVALVQLLREVYDNSTSSMYSPEEMPTVEVENTDPPGAGIHPAYTDGSAFIDYTRRQDMTVKDTDAQPPDPFTPLLRSLNAMFDYRGDAEPVRNFVDQTAQALKKDQHAIISEALNNLDSFHAGLVKFIYTATTTTEVTSPPPAPKAWYCPENWLKLKKNNFTALMLDHQDRFEEVTGEMEYRGKRYFILHAMRLKWETVNPDQRFPGDPEPESPVEPEPEPDPKPSGRTSYGPPPRPEQYGKQAAVPPPGPEKSLHQDPDPPHPSGASPLEHTNPGINPGGNREQRDENIRLRTNHYDDWKQARTDLNFGGNVPLSEEAAQWWNKRIGELIDSQNQ